MTTRTETSIRVENVDYYSFGPDMKTTPISAGGLLPKELNGHMEYLNHTIRKLPICNLNIKMTPSKSLDSKMESLLDYIRQKGFGAKKPDFVTTKDLLKSVASMEANLIYVCRYGGVNYILRMDSESTKTMENNEKIFEHFMTKKQNEEMDGNTVRKGVFKATILKGERDFDNWNILYSGKVDAVRRTLKGNLRHYELKVTNGPVGGDYFWSENSCSHFWQSFFGGSPSLIIGSRTDKLPYHKVVGKTEEGELLKQKYPKFSIYEIKEITRDSMPTNVSELPWRLQWKVSHGKENLRDFLQSVKNRLKTNGDCYVFTRNMKTMKWEIKKDEQAVAEFRDLIKKYITV